jgi:hypothetical protein
LGQGQQLLVPGQVRESENGIPPVLLGSEEIALTSNGQVRPGDLKTVVGLPEDLQAFSSQLPGLRYQNASASVGPPAHTTPELVEL